MESFPREKFFNVNYLILKQQIPVIDDTLIEKLISLIQNAFKFRFTEEESLQLLDKLELSSIDPVYKNESLPEENRAYGIQLIGILGHFIHTYKKQDPQIDIVTEVIKHWCNSIDEKQCSASIRAAGLKMLLMLCCCQEGIDLWITKDVIAIAFKCLTDESIFVVKIAQDFLVSVVSKISDGSETDSSNYCSSKNDMADFVMKYLTNELKMAVNSKCYLKSTSNDRKLIAILGLIKTMIDQDISLIDKSLLRNICLKLLIHCSEDISQKTCDVLISILNESRIVISDLENIFEILQKKDYNSVKVNFSLNLLYNHRNLSAEVEDRLLSVIVAPLKTQPENWNLSSFKDMSLTLNSICTLKHYFKSKESQNNIIHQISQILDNSSNYREGPLHNNLFIRLQIIAVDCLVKLVPVWFHNEEMENAFSVILNVIDNPSTSSMVLNKSMKGLAIILNYFYSRKIPEANNLLTKIVKQFQILTDLLSKRVLNLQWEVKDSSLELISHLFLFSQEIPSCQEILVESKVSLWILQALEDTESFVRATALSVLGNISAVNCFWQDLTKNYNEKLLYSRVIQLLHNDTEAIVRRSATHLLFQWYKSSNCRFNKEMINKEMFFAIQDLDWEVKLTALKFWDSVITDLKKNLEIELNHFCTNEEIPQYASFLQSSKSFHSNAINRKTKINNFLQQLHKTGFCAALIIAFNDYDSPVKEKASQMLYDLQQNLVEADVVKLKKDPTDIQDCNSVQTFNSSGLQLQSVSKKTDFPDMEVTVHQNKVLEELMNTDDRTLVTAIELLSETDKVISVSNSEYSGENEPMESECNKEENNKAVETISLSSFLQTLEETNIEHFKQQFSKSHNFSIEDILDDILCNTNDIENNVLDCY